MSKIIATKAIKGAHKIVARADEMLKKAITEKGEDAKLEFPDTAYYLPLIYAMLGLKVTKLKEAIPVIEKAKSLLPKIPSEKLWLPYLGNTLDAGMATILAEEVIEVLKYVLDPKFVKEPWLGFTPDPILREQGIKLVDGRMPGFAACVGACPTNADAVKLVRELQEKNILIFLASSTNGKSIAEQIHEEGIEMGWDNYIVPYGKDTSAAVLALNFAARSAMTFGGITPKGMKEAREILMYNRNRVNAFVIALGEVDDEKFATAAGAINFGFPTIADTDIDQILPTGICKYEHVVSPITLENMVSKSIEVRGLKITVSKLPIPVSFGPAFEGERVRKEQLGVEFGGKYSKGFEYVRMKDMAEVEDNKITVVGSDIDTVPDGGNLPLGILVEVAGRKMQKEFETILERKLHSILSEAMGVMHTGQRNLIWIRVNKEAIKAGLRLKHFGTIIHAMLLKEFPAIVDKVQVTIYTNLADVEKILPDALASYQERDERMAGMTDESVDIFYSCQLCQSYAPNHVCIITPERLGLCGSYNWLDGKAAYEINPTGANQPVQKGAVIDALRGQWEGINKFVYERSNRIIEKFNAYSFMEFPETSCFVGDTEVIIDNKLTKIGDFIDTHRGKEDYVKSRALTLKDEKAKFDNIVAMQRFPAPSQLIKITTKSGVDMVLTANHKVAVDRENGIKWIPAGKIKEKDRIVSLKKLEIKEEVPELNEIIPDNFKDRVNGLKLNEDLFYLLGLLASDGSIFKVGKNQYKINFINTEENLLSIFSEIYTKLFPKNKLGRYIKKSKGVIKGCRINSIKECYQYYSNNTILGIIAEYFGIKINPSRNWKIKNMLNLPENLIASFLCGLFDGDGSVRQRKYDGKWDVGEGYLCISDEKSARHIQILLKRFGIIGNVRKSTSVFKIEMHGSNLLKFAELISPKHPAKLQVLNEIKISYSKDKLDKSQKEVLPYFVGKKLSELPNISKVLSSSTLSYYRTGKSRPIRSNVERVIASLPEAEKFKSLLDSDYFLDIVKKIEVINNNDKYDYVYNITLADIHSYIVNGGPWVKNCGCFECIVAIVPEANGVMVVNRGFSGMTPVGMTFSTLAGSVGGGLQTPGFLGVGRLYLTSKKFISAEGGFHRLLWMPKELKEVLGDRLKKRADELGTPDFIDKIADEAVATTAEELLVFLQKVNHPALTMPSLM